MKKGTYKTTTLRMVGECVDLGSRTLISTNRTVYCHVAAVGLGRLMAGGMPPKKINTLLTEYGCSQEFHRMLAESIVLKGKLSTWTS